MSKTTMLFFIILLLTPNLSDAADRISDGDKDRLRLTLEPIVKENYDKQLAEFRQYTAGKTSRDIALATEAIKTTIYNKAYRVFRCLIDTMTINPDGSVGLDHEKLHACEIGSNRGLIKFGKILDYLSVIGREKQVRCELKSRLLDAENEFPSYNFLKRPDGTNALYDYELMTSCLVADDRQ